MTITTEGDHALSASASDVAGNTSALSSAVHINFDITPPNTPQLEWDGQNITIKLDGDIKESDIIDLNIDGNDHKILISKSDIDNGYINYEWLFKEHENTNEIYSYITDAAGNKSETYDIEKKEDNLTEFEFNKSNEELFQKGGHYLFGDLVLNMENISNSAGWKTGIFKYDGTMNLQIGNLSDTLISSKNNSEFNVFDFTLGNMNDTKTGSTFESMTVSFLDENGQELYSKILDSNSGLSDKSDHVRIEMPELNSYFTTVKIHSDGALLWLNDIKLSSNNFSKKNIENENKSLSTNIKYDDVIHHENDLLFNNQNKEINFQEENSTTHSQYVKNIDFDIEFNSASNLGI